MFLEEEDLEFPISELPYPKHPMDPLDRPSKRRKRRTWRDAKEYLEENSDSETLKEIMRNYEIAKSDVPSSTPSVSVDPEYEDAVEYFRDFNDEITEFSNTNAE